jgi:hypothetical protein
MMSGTLRAARLRLDGTEAYWLLTSSAWQGAPIEIGSCPIQLDLVRLYAQVSKACGWGLAPHACHRFRGSSSGLWPVDQGRWWPDSRTSLHTERWDEPENRGTPRGLIRGTANLAAAATRNPQENKKRADSLSETRKLKRWTLVRLSSPTVRPSKSPCPHSKHNHTVGTKLFKSHNLHCFLKIDALKPLKFTR